MSRSFHVTTKAIKGLTRKEVDDQLDDPSSDLRQLARKSLYKKEVKKSRKSGE